MALHAALERQALSCFHNYAMQMILLIRVNFQGFDKTIQKTGGAF